MTEANDFRQSFEMERFADFDFNAHQRQQGSQAQVQRQQPWNDRSRRTAEEREASGAVDEESAALAQKQALRQAYEGEKGGRSPLQQLLDAHRLNSYGYERPPTSSSPSMQSTDSRLDGTGSSKESLVGQRPHSASSTAPDHDPFREALDMYQTKPANQRRMQAQCNSGGQSSTGHSPGRGHQQGNSSNRSDVAFPSSLPYAGVLGNGSNVHSSEDELVHRMQESLGLDFDEGLERGAPVNQGCGGKERETAESLPHEWIPNRQLSCALQALQDQATQSVPLQHQLWQQQQASAPWPPQPQRSNSGPTFSSSALGNGSPALAHLALGNSGSKSSWIPGHGGLPGPRGDSRRVSSGSSGTGTINGTGSDPIGAPYSALLSAHARKSAAAFAASRSQHSLPSGGYETHEARASHPSPVCAGRGQPGYDPTSSCVLGPSTPSASGSSTHTSVSESQAGTPLDLLRSHSASTSALEPSSPAYFAPYLQQQHQQLHSHALSKKPAPAGASYFQQRQHQSQQQQQFSDHAAYDSHIQPLSLLGQSSPILAQGLLGHDTFARYTVGRHPDKAFAKRPSPMAASSSSKSDPLYAPAFVNSSNSGSPLTAIHAAAAGPAMSTASSPAGRTSALQDAWSASRQLRSRSLIDQDGGPSGVAAVAAISANNNDGTASGPPAPKGVRVPAAAYDGNATTTDSQWLAQALDSLGIRGAGITDTPARASPKCFSTLSSDFVPRQHAPAHSSPVTIEQVQFSEEFWNLLAQRAAEGGLTAPAAGLGVELGSAKTSSPGVGRVIPAPPGQPGPAPHNRKVDLYKTELCRQWEEKGSCRYGAKCQFAHGSQELRPVERHRLYKTQICRTYFLTGSCPYARRCCFVHMTPAMQAGAPQEDEVSKPPLLARLKGQQSAAAGGSSPASPRQRTSSNSNSADVAVSRLHEALSNAKASPSDIISAFPSKSNRIGSETKQSGVTAAIQ